MRSTQSPEEAVRKAVDAVSVCRCLYVVKYRHFGSSRCRDRNSFAGDSVVLDCMGLPVDMDAIANQPGKTELVDSRVERQVSVNGLCARLHHTQQQNVELCT